MAEVLLNGPDGRIEAKYHQSTQAKAPAILILHPHPEHGGDMNNKVVYNIDKTFINAGFSTLRINFPGVGKSAGHYDNGIGELMAAACALDWMQLQNIDANQYWIAGFSFGAWIALQLVMRRPEVSNCVLVAPPAGKYDFSFISPCLLSSLVIQGTLDSVVSEKAVSEFVKKMLIQNGISTEYKIVEGADHFFRNKIDDLNNLMLEYINSDRQAVMPQHLDFILNDIEEDDDAFDDLDFDLDELSLDSSDDEKFNDENEDEDYYNLFKDGVK